MCTIGRILKNLLTKYANRRIIETTKTFGLPKQAEREIPWQNGKTEKLLFTKIDMEIHVAAYAMSLCFATSAAICRKRAPTAEHR